jgi:hypothetical protein
MKAVIFTTSGKSWITKESDFAVQDITEQLNVEKYRPYIVFTDRDGNVIRIMKSALESWCVLPEREDNQHV